MRKGRVRGRRGRSCTTRMRGTGPALLMMTSGAGETPGYYDGVAEILSDAFHGDLLRSARGNSRSYRPDRRTPMDLAVRAPATPARSSTACSGRTGAGVQATAAARSIGLTLAALHPGGGDGPDRP
ncbi:hypothetical protein ACRAWF_32190 [Streptomyces sp. L7]